MAEFDEASDSRFSALCTSEECYLQRLGLLANHLLLLDLHSSQFICDIDGNRGIFSFLPKQIRICIPENELIAVKKGRNGCVSSGFGWTEHYDLSDNKFPILVSKRVFWKLAVKELFWMIRGSTDVRDLQEMGINYWNAHGELDFIQSHPHYNSLFPTRKEWDLGPVYGFQLRFFGAEYMGSTRDCDYTGRGTDQLLDLITNLKSDPYSRRHIISLWNPNDINKSNLPPCHMCSQFIVVPPSESTNGRPGLVGILYQRSGDMALGVPFNVVMYTTMIHLIAFVCDFEPIRLVHTIGDYHLYQEHAKTAFKQATAHYEYLHNLKLKGHKVSKSPKIRIRPDATKDILQLTPDDVIVTDYYPMCSLKYKLIT